MEDLSFAVMDFAAHQRRDLAFRVLNAWLDQTGDHAGLSILRFAVVYRDMVRAQVAMLSDKGATAATVAAPGRPSARQYVDTALAWSRRSAVELFVTHGLPGSGKTYVSQRVLEAHAAIRLRSDVERKRLFGLDMLADSRAAGVDLYQPEVTARTYAHLIDTARVLLRAGFSVVLDAAFLRRAERAQALALARELGVPMTILLCEAPVATLQQRLQTRRGDASEADVAVLAQLCQHAEPLGEDEKAQVRLLSLGGARER